MILTRSPGPDDWTAALLDEVGEVAAAVEPFAEEADASPGVHPGVLAALRDSRVCELMVPRAYGGRFESVDPVAVCRAREVFMAVSSHLDSLFALQGIGSFAISVGGSESQRSEWLPRVARADALAALALTEPEVGSDLSALSTVLEQRGDRVRVKGFKSWISNAGAADFYTVLAREGEGFSAVCVPATAPGVECTPLSGLIAPHVIGDVRFDVDLPAGARIGGPGQGSDLIFSTLAVFRVSVGAAAVGLARAALEEAVRHTRTRVQFGKPLAEHGPVAQMLADSAVDLEMSRLLVYQVAEEARRDPRGTLHRSAMAKVAATEAAGRVVDRCVQVMGRFGLVSGSKVERCYRQARPMRIYEGANEVLRLTISRRLVKEVE